ncbi:MAG: hypothetical protein AW07_04484 [Candidatus Accumulibacter sp. SK-11]|nr:MAG: hypothetical protein AW07_04484 [Candidatus Accumulibacter sp. SK-11]
MEGALLKFVLQALVAQDQRHVGACHVFGEFGGGRADALTRGMAARSVLGPILCGEGT